MSEEDALQAAIDAAPLDRLPRLVFCDWLEERGDERAEGYRVLTEYDRWPWVSIKVCAWYLSDDEIPLHKMQTPSAVRNHGVDRSGLPRGWERFAPDYYETRRQAMDAAARGWSQMLDEVRAECLAELDAITARIGAPSR